MTADELARVNLWRCEAVARELTAGRPWDRDEAHSVALVGLAEAIRSFDPAKGDAYLPAARKFEAHAQVTIWSRVFNHLGIQAAPKGYRTADPERRARRPDILALPGTGHAAIDAEAPPVGWLAEWEDEVESLSRRLPPRHGEVIRCRLLHADGALFEGVARRTNMTKSTVHRLYHEAIEMLRESCGRATA